MRWFIAAVLFLFAAFAGLIGASARSDFRFRGCPQIPRAEWELTANCLDGWFAMIFFGGLSILSAGAALWLIGGRWRA